MLEVLFGIQPTASKKETVTKPAAKKIETVTILDARKAHNSAIQLCALRLARREVYEVLLEGKVYTETISDGTFFTDQVSDSHNFTTAETISF